MADKVFFLNVGYGSCTVMHLQEKVVMVDCHQGNLEEGEENILDYIPDKKIDLLILTHQHYDHFDGIRTLLENDVKVQKIWESAYQRKYGDKSVSCNEWKKYRNLTKKLKVKRYKPTRSKIIYDKIGGTSFQILNPPKNINSIEGGEIHDGCLVIFAYKSGMSILFTSDASYYAIENVTNYFELKDINVLTASHHGALNEAHLDFIKSVKPDYTVVSTREGVYDIAPNPAALKIYKKYSRKRIVRTDRHGTMLFVIYE